MCSRLIHFKNSEKHIMVVEIKWNKNAEGVIEKYKK
jgi:hypothetical protein